ncbi:hypothetical protein ADICEAN_00678 [Cesiribacter andamanensis AMV16]|uniref:Uncharacterized protein n=1 Tax=Cesiribacter andamanensis AMV16 TaxID=1279009 RepID=M7P0N4_9BACT|nr:hypothetical protein ADICEAN_00678 [Cesiribacter andamanensis AMV16]
MFNNLNLLQLRAIGKMIKWMDTSYAYKIKF